VDYDDRARRLSRVGLYPSRYIEDITANNAYLYLAEGVRGLSVIDASNPAWPLRVSGSDLEYVTGVAGIDEYALTVDGEGFRVVRVLIPEWLARRGNAEP